MLHGNFWVNLEMDLTSGQFVKKDCLLSTPESLYRMTDPDFMVKALKDDLMLEMSLFCRGDVKDIDVERINLLGEILGCATIRSSDLAEQRDRVADVRDAYAFAATQHIVEQAVKYIEGKGKKLMVVLLYPQVIRELIETGKRYDQPIVDYLKSNRICYFDMNLVHVEDYKCFNLTLDGYMDRYFIGHYSPAGNHFFAYSIKNSIVEWLDPKPITYRDDEQTIIDFRDYLPDGWRIDNVVVEQLP